MAFSALLLTFALTANPALPTPHVAPADSSTGVVQQVRLDKLQPGDRLEIRTGGANYLAEIVNPRTGEVRLSTSNFKQATRAFINGATRGRQPELFVMMGVLKTGMRMEFVETRRGSAGAINGRQISSEVTRLRLLERDLAT